MRSLSRYFMFLVLFLSGTVESKLLFCTYGRFFAKLSIASYRKPEIIPSNLCTHIVYRWAKTVNLEVKPDGRNDQEINNDTRKGLYMRINSLKKRNSKLKTLLSICDLYRHETKKILASVDSRKQFSSNVLKYAKKWNFDGVDLLFQQLGFYKSRTNFTLLCKSMRKTIQKDYQEMLFTVTTHTIEPNNIYEMDKFHRYVDYIHLFTYDFIPRWKVTPLNMKVKSKAPMDRIIKQIDRWIKATTPSKKLLLGVAANGRTLKITSGVRKEAKLGDRVSTHGYIGNRSRTRGYLYYNEICELAKNKMWKFGWDTASQTPYYVHGDTLITYDNKASLAVKLGKIVDDKGLGGVSVWEITQDDALGIYCDNGSFPLVSYIHNAFNLGTVDYVKLRKKKATVTPATTSGTKAFFQDPVYRSVLSLFYMLY